MFDTDDADCPPYILGSPRLILRAQGIAKLAEHGHLPNVPETQIADKSKANFVAKILATLQASWFLVQCVARWEAHLTMTLLELNTLAHVICALLIDLLWMNKPYDVHEPIKISGEWVRPLCATMWMFSSISTEKQGDGRSYTREIERLLFADVSHLPSLHRVRKQNFEANAQREVTGIVENEEDLTLPPPHGEDIELGPKRQENSMDALPPTSKSNGKSDQSARPVICLSYKTSVTRYMSQRGSLLNNEMCLETGFGPKQKSVHWTERHEIPLHIYITEIKLTRWRLASAVLRENRHIWGQYAKQYTRIPEVEAGCPIYEFPANCLKANFVDPQVSNWPGNDILGREGEVLQSFLLSFATAAYGGIHALAWNEYFATASKCHWWIFSSVFVAASGAVFSLRPIRNRPWIRLDMEFKCRWLNFA